MRRGFVTAGTWCVDRNLTVDAWPAEDMAATVREVEVAGGGSACNFAVDMRRLDPEMPVETQGVVGRDAHGDFLVSVADAYGVSHDRLVRLDGDATQATDAYLSRATGRRTHMLFYGLAARMCPDHFDFSESTARVLHLGLPGIHERMDAPWGEDANGWVTVLKMGRASGLKTNLEFVAGPEDSIRRVGLPCLPHLDTLVVNDQEIGALAGLPTVACGSTRIDLVRKAVRAVLEMGAMEMVAAHFPHGAVMASRDGEDLYEPSVVIPDDERHGANGAGDAFSAGFHYALHEGWPGKDCLRLGHAAAAACLRAAGTYTSVGSVAECLELAAKWGWRGD